MRTVRYNESMDTFLNRLPVAHRGLHDDEKPENSLAAFEAAAERGYAIETDVHFTADGQIAVFHDDTLVRMTGDPRKVSECTMSELKTLKLKETEERIPTFEEFLQTVGGRVPLLIEIKNMEGVKGKKIAAALAAALDGYSGEYAIQSFNPFYVKAYKKLRPKVMCGVLASNMRGSDFGGTLRGTLKAWLLRDLRLNFTVKPDFVSYAESDLPRRSVEKFRGMKLAWTIRSPEQEARARKFVENIIFENYLADKK